MIQFTESIFVINSMYAGVNVIKAKNAFLKKLNRANISQKEIENEGEKEWRSIEATYKPVLKWKNEDFTALEGKLCKPDDTHSENRKTKVIPSLPPPPPPPPPSHNYNT